MNLQKRDKPIKDKGHRYHVATLPCCCCGRPSGPAHHLIGRYAGIPNREGIKRGDNYAIPLCPPHHDKVHNAGLRGEPNEVEFLAQYGVDGLSMAMKIWNENNRSLKSSQEKS